MPPPITPPVDVTPTSLQDHIIETVRHLEAGDLELFASQPPPVLDGTLSAQECNELRLLLHELKTRFAPPVLNLQTPTSNEEI